MTDHDHPSTEHLLIAFRRWLRDDPDRPEGSAPLTELDGAIEALFERAGALGGDLRDPTPSLIRHALVGGDDPYVDMEALRFYLLFLRAVDRWRRSERTVEGCWDAVDDFGRTVDGISFSPYDEVVAETVDVKVPRTEVAAGTAGRPCVRAIDAIIDGRPDRQGIADGAALLGLAEDSPVARAWWLALSSQGLVDTDGDTYGVDRWRRAEPDRRGLITDQLTSRLIKVLFEDLLDESDDPHPEVVATVSLMALLNACFTTEGITSRIAGEATVGRMAQPQGELDDAIDRAMALVDDLTTIGVLDRDGDYHRSPDALDPSILRGLVAAFDWGAPAGDPAAFTWEPVELPLLVPPGTTLTLWFAVTEFEDEIWRRITIPAEAPLHLLHLSIQRTLGWEDQDPHAFLDADDHPRFTAPNELASFDGRDDDRLTDSTAVALGAVLSAPGQELTYRYHRWLVTVSCEAVEQTGAVGTDALTQLGGGGPGPFEEAGDAAGWRHWLAALDDTHHPDHAWVKHRFEEAAAGERQRNMAAERAEAGEDPLVPSFIPALVVLLVAAERSKAAPLTREEVEAIRDGATCVMLPRSAVDAVAAERGYADLDPERAWEEWQLARESFG